MKNIAIKILMELEKQGELSLEKIADLLPKKFKDHRDFYVFASLVAIEYVDDDHLLDKDNSDPNRNKEQLLAREYFACSTEDKTATYENHTWSKSGGGGTLKGQKFALSGKGSLYLSEYRAKRFDRVYTLAAGIFIGILVALISAYLK
jgi:hypothetical protein